MKIKFKLKIFWALLTILTIFFSIFSVFQISAIAVETRLIQSYKEKLEKIKQENETLILNSVRLNSLNNTNELIKPFGFVEIGKVHHIKTLGDVVVTR